MQGSLCQPETAPTDGGQTGPQHHRGRVISQMRFFKPVVVIAAICATMLTMRKMWSRRTARGKRHGLRRAR